MVEDNKLVIEIKTFCSHERFLCSKCDKVSKRDSFIVSGRPWCELCLKKFGQENPEHYQTVRDTIEIANNTPERICSVMQIIMETQGVNLYGWPNVRVKFDEDEVRARPEYTGKK